jgi:hypothetical protein
MFSVGPVTSARSVSLNDARGAEDVVEKRAALQHEPLVVLLGEMAYQRGTRDQLQDLTFLQRRATHLVVDQLACRNRNDAAPAAAHLRASAGYSTSSSTTTRQRGSTVPVVRPPEMSDAAQRPLEKFTGPFV